MEDMSGSDIVELIIAVDLNPSDPEEPLNVSSVDVRDKGEGGDGGGDWQKLAMQLLMGDPASGVTSDSISYDEAVDAVARVLGKEEEPEAEDPFSRATRRPQEPGMGMGGGQGMKMALDRALGRRDDEDEEEY
jgi:hypothetical protein